MAKIFFLSLIFLFQPGAETAFSQSGTDSARMDVSTDSLHSDAGDSVETFLINPYSLYRLIAQDPRRPDHPLREVGSRQVRSYQVNPDYNYANDSAYWKTPTSPKTGSGKTGFNGRVFQWIFMSLMVGLVLYGIFQLARENNFTWLSRKNTPAYTDPGMAPKENEMDLLSAVQKYQDEGNYRMAVRCLYLNVLREITARTGIRVPDSSTNAEIALAFGDRTAGGDFQYLYKAYEYIYYGDFIPSPELYAALRIRFEEFQKNLLA